MNVCQEVMKLHPSKFEPGDMLSCWVRCLGSDHEWLYPRQQSLTTLGDHVVVTVVRIHEKVPLFFDVTMTDGQTFCCFNVDDYECIKRL